MGEEAPAGAAGAGAGPVGRARELAELAALLDTAVAGRGAVCLVTGEPGIGKTTVATAFAAAAADRAEVLWGACPAPGVAPAYWPWRQALRGLASGDRAAALREALGREAATHAARVVPELAGAPPAGPEPSRFALFEAVATLLTTAARERPLVVVLDDVHDADAPSVALLAFLARALATEPVLFVGTAREHEALLREDLEVPLTRVGPDTRLLPLGGLAREDVGTLVGRRLTAAADEAFVAALAERTNGNPLFLDGLLTLAARAGDLERGAAALPLPSSLRDTIRRRLAPLPPEALELLGAAAVAGMEVPVALLAAMVEREPAAVLDGLEPARLLGLVEDVARPGEPRVAFVHALVREALHDGLPAVRRAELHRAAGRALEARLEGQGAPPLAELAHHFAGAAVLGEARRARDYAARAAEQAMGVSAWEEAVRHLGAALELHAQLAPDERARYELLLALGRARTRGGDVEGGRDALVEAADVARALEEPRAFVDAVLELGAVGLPPGDADEKVVALLEEALDLLDGEPGALRARVLARLAVQLYWTGTPERRAALVTEARALAARLDDDPAAQLDALAQVQMATSGPESPERLADLDRLLELARRVGDPERELHLRVWRVAVLLQLGRLRDASAEAEAFARVAERLNQPRWTWYVPLLRAVRALAEGRLDDAEALREEAGAIGLQVQGSMAPMLLGAMLVATRWTQRDLGDLVGPVTALTDAKPAMVAWRATRVAALLDAGREEEARAEVRTLTAGGRIAIPVDTTFLSSCALLAEAAHRLGEAPAARALYHALEPYAGHCATLPSGAFLGPVARFLGVLASTAGDPDAALEHLAAARALAEANDLRAMCAWIALDEAEALRARGEPGDADAARAAAERARVLAAEVGLPALVAEADVRLAEAPRAPAPVREPGAAEAAEGLLRREGDVWTIAVGDHQVQLTHAKGLAYLAELLQRPGVEIHALDLAGAPAGEDAPPPEGDLGPVLDDEAKAAYRARMEELQAEVEEAEAFNDPERADRAREELEALAGELSKAVGLGGRDRRPGSAAEKARVNATRAIRSVLRRIADHDMTLSYELVSTITTGTYCCYRPDPRRPVAWTVEDR